MRNIFLLMSLFFLFSCSDKKEEAQNFIPENKTDLKLEAKTIVGISCGECTGNCFTAFMIENGKAYRHSSTSIPSGENFIWTLMPDSNFKNIETVFNSLPNNMGFYKSPIGEPDAHDQCGIYVRINEGMENKTWMIDPDNGKHPAAFDNFVSALMKLN